ncbi:MAG: hypothetical protein ACF8LL_13265 [Phycisphaerales bacterium]
MSDERGQTCVFAREWKKSNASDGTWLAWLLTEIFDDRLGWLCWTVLSESGWGSDVYPGPRGVLVDLGDDEQVQIAIDAIADTACEAHLMSWNATCDRRIIEPRYEQFRGRPGGL